MRFYQMLSQYWAQNQTEELILLSVEAGPYIRIRTTSLCPLDEVEGQFKMELVWTGRLWSGRQPS